MLQPKRAAEQNNHNATKKLKPDVPSVDPLDIGRFLCTPGVLDDDKKFELINIHWKPPASYCFPFCEFGAITRHWRRFCSSCLNCYPWLCYSKLYDRAKLSKLYNEPMVKWKTAAHRLAEHEASSVVHKDSLLRLTSFKSVMSGKIKGIDEQADNLRRERIMHNEAILGSIVDTIIAANQAEYCFAVSPWVLVTKSWKFPSLFELSNSRRWHIIKGSLWKCSKERDIPLQNCRESIGYHLWQANTEEDNCRNQQQQHPILLRACRWSN